MCAIWTCILSIMSSLNPQVLGEDGPQLGSLEVCTVSKRGPLYYGWSLTVLTTLGLHGDKPVNLLVCNVQATNLIEPMSPNLCFCLPRPPEPAQCAGVERLWDQQGRRPGWDCCLLCPRHGAGPVSQQAAGLAWGVVSGFNGILTFSQVQQIQRKDQNHIETHKQVIMFLYFHEYTHYSLFDVVPHTYALCWKYLSNNRCVNPQQKIVPNYPFLSDKNFKSHRFVFKWNLMFAIMSGNTFGFHYCFNIYRWRKCFMHTIA